MQAHKPASAAATVQFDLPFGSGLPPGPKIQQLLHMHRAMFPLPVFDGVHSVP